MELVLPLIVLALSFLIDILIYTNLPSHRKPSETLSGLNITFVLFAGASLVVLQPCLCSALLLLTGIFRAVNLGRVLAWRLHPVALKKKFAKSAVTLGLLSVVFASGIVIEPSWNKVVALGWVSLVGTSVLLANTIMSVFRWRPKQMDMQSLEKVPTVSICVPARNETQDLPDCIESLLNCNYPKLEILVLDDCSHDKTPEIIKKYAHQGVRFIKGSEPTDDWLAKNMALNKLFDESLGDVVIYAGVDVRFSRDTVQKIVEQLSNGTDMLSVLPYRHESKELSVFIQPLRYWWELSVPRFRKRRPPVLSTCWAISREALKKIGEFDSVRRSVQPERHFAEKLKEKYTFVMSGNRMGIKSVKRPREQFDTAQRVRYPQARRRPETALLLILFQAALGVVPIVGLFYGNRTISIISIVNLSVVNLIISTLIVRKTWLVSALTYPILMIEDWYLLLRSMLAYEFGVVRWKERNICLPMLSVEPSLPKIKK